MNKFIIILLFIFILISTVLICVFQPKSHKHIMFENRNFKLEMITEKIHSEKNQVSFSIPQIEVPDVPSLPQINQPVQIEKKVDTYKPDKTQKNNIPVKKINSEIKKTEVPQKIKTVSPPQTPAITVKQNTPQPNIEKTNKSEMKIPEPEIPLLVQEQNEKKQAELEIIAWNKWRSDLQNKLMRDSKIAAPIGTTFFFSFTVDKYGNISNLKTWSNNSSYTPLAVKVIKPLLLSYQHTSILVFPTNSKRIITNAEGSFTMAHSSQYSSPADYNDYERIIK